MATRDAAFLAEVESFLVSFDLPTFPSLQALKDTENSDEALSTTPIPVKPEVPLQNPIKKTPKTKKQRQLLDPVAKHELDKEKDRKRRSKYREKRKMEKEELQQQVGDLTTQLTDLQKAKEAERSLASTAWEIVAQRQLQARVDAEEKQRRMIRAIESRAALIQEFQGVFDHCNNVETEMEIMEQGAYKRKRIRLEPSDAEFYKLFAKELEGSYARTDETLKTYGLDSTDAHWETPRKQSKEDGETGYYMYSDKYVMPFDFQQICRFTWNVAQMQHRQEDRECFEGLEDPDNTSAFKFRVTTRLSSGRSVSVLQRAVVRRFIEDERSIVVWRSFAEGEGMFTGMHADECGWCISVPLSDTPEPSTLIRTMMRHVPMHFSSTATHAPDAEQFTDFVLDTGAKDATEIANRLEKLLLQDK